ncbi:hypothetical protein M433DRAFT_5962 [Acidomyces richmondensis BFW]|nr:MAG: hypothetical protein FE78DRAFT_72854 [Acidomyces sp. 'richmondensis']KYG43851.1 hypothetical protein M433DRAFT_5962 [Acidomyces richmondensis BFW]
MSKTFKLNFMGDVMLGRLIDQMFPQHVDEPKEKEIAQNFLNRHPHLKNYGPETPWSNTLTLLHEADLNLINLETSATTHSIKWPDKVFNYRMHPANVSALQAANIHYAGLANNHTLDFGEPGLLETIRTIRSARIAFAGAGETHEESVRPAVLQLPRSGGGTYDIHVWAASDHPHDWAKISTFHLFDYSRSAYEHFKQVITAPSSKHAALKIISVHWGPNYSWHPSEEIIDLAHYFIDECGIDIVHGHSSHHCQGVEIYKGKLIIYGSGDFIDDYAVNKIYRNDLGGIWMVHAAENGEGGGLRLKRLELYPTRIENFLVRRLEGKERDSEWLRRKIKSLSKEFDTEWEVEADGEGRLILFLSEYGPE